MRVSVPVFHPSQYVHQSTSTVSGKVREIRPQEVCIQTVQSEDHERPNTQRRNVVAVPVDVRVVDIVWLV